MKGLEQLESNLERASRMLKYFQLLASKGELKDMETFRLTST
jgi:hypothetical protein